MNWTLAFRNLFRNKRRTLVTAIALVAGCVGLTLLGGYLLRSERGLKANAVYLNHRGHILIYKKDSFERFNSRPGKYRLSGEDLAALDGLLAEFEPRIEWKGRTLTGAGLISNGQKSVPFMGIGVETASFARALRHPFVREWADDAIAPAMQEFSAKTENNPLGISITARLGEFLNRPVPFSKLSEDDASVQLAGMSYFGDLNAVNAVLIANHTTGMEFTEDAGLMAPLPLLQELYATDGVQFVSLFLKDEGDQKALLGALNEKFTAHGGTFEAFPFSHPLISPHYVGSMGFLYAMAGFFVFLVCGAVILSIVNSITIGILERSRELGTFRAIGYRTGQLGRLITLEAFCLSVLSTAAGLALAFVLAGVINGLAFKIAFPGYVAPVTFLIKPSLAWAAIVFVILNVLTVVTAAVVTRLQMRQRIVELLTDTGG